MNKIKRTTAERYEKAVKSLLPKRQISPVYGQPQRKPIDSKTSNLLKSSTEPTIIDNDKNNKIPMRKKKLKRNKNIKSKMCPNCDVIVHEDSMTYHLANTCVKRS